jgi:myosin heavy subunit
MENNKKSQVALATIAILLLLASIGDVFLLRKNGMLSQERNQAVLHSDSLLSIKLNADKQIATLSEENLKCNNKTNELDSIVIGLTKELEAKKTELIRIQNSEGNSGKLKKQLKDALKKNAECNTQVNDLLKEVANLEKKIAELNDAIGSLKANNYELTTKFEKASSLKAYDILITSYKKARVTQKAKRTNRINVNFTIPENDLIEAGSKEVNLLIYSPKGQVISAKGNKFQNKTLQKEQVYSENKSINYNNKDTKGTLDVECNCKLEKGSYKVEIYIEGKLAGKKEFALK